MNLLWWGPIATLTLGFLCFCPTRSHANDTNALLAAGGLVFVRTDSLKMESENLIVSPTEIRVVYRFRNLTDHAINTTVAFPIPDINTRPMSESPHQFHKSSRDGDILNFKLKINGQPTSPQFEAHAYTPDGKDITALLTKYGVPLVDSANSHEVWDAIWALGPNSVEELTGAHALIDDDLHHPNWVVKAAYHWQQTFPANHMVEVEHSYEPILGGAPMSPSALRENERVVRTWCTDDTIAKAVLKLPQPGYNDQRDVATNWLEYILTTGANWAGPIGRFRLEIDKGEADFLSLCPLFGLSLHSHGRSFVGEARDFTPTSDLKILFIYGNCEHRPCLQ